MKKCRSWIVRMKCTVTKNVVCDNCTEKQAEEDPFTHAVSEDDDEMIDYEVTSVEPNE